MEETDHILDAPQAERSRLQFAGFWVRTGAYLIDVIILAVVNFVIGLVLAGMLADQAAATLLSIVIGVGYFGYMESSENQATFGKMAVGIKVGDENGDRISLPNAIGRYFAKILSGLILFIGFMMVGWDPKNQGLHDKLASTYVFYKD